MPYTNTVFANIHESWNVLCLTGMDSLMQDWHTTDIEVRVRENHDDPDLVGQNGIIRSVSVSTNIILTVWTVMQ